MTSAAARTLRPAPVPTPEASAYPEPPVVAAEPAASTRTVERALALLAEVCAERSISLSECARRADLPTSTALRLLRTLERSQFVSRSELGHFTAGPRLIQLGAAALGRESLVPLAQPSLRRLVRLSGESAYVGVRGPGRTAVYAGMVEGTHAVRHVGWVGRTVPLSGSAIGRALEDRIPAAGFVCVRSAVEPDVTAVAAPIRSPIGVIGALSLVGPNYRMDSSDIDSHGTALAAEAARISAVFGSPDQAGE